MNCPRCFVPLASAATACSRCGFSSLSVCQRLGDHLVRLDHLNDAAHCLKQSERRRIEGQLDDFDRRFPQVFLAVYCGVLPHGLNVSEAGFWLLNHAALATSDLAKRSDFGIVLIIDPAAGRAAFSVGYALENTLTQKHLQQILLGMKPHLAHSNYSEAASIAIRGIDRTLRSLGRSQPRACAAAHASPVDTDLGLPVLRARTSPPQTRPVTESQHHP